MTRRLRKIDLAKVFIAISAFTLTPATIYANSFFTSSTLVVYSQGSVALGSGILVRGDKGHHHKETRVRGPRHGHSHSRHGHIIEHRHREVRVRTPLVRIRSGNHIGKQYTTGHGGRQYVPGYSTRTYTPSKINSGHYIQAGPAKRYYNPRSGKNTNSSSGRNPNKNAYVVPARTPACLNRKGGCGGHTGHSPGNAMQSGNVAVGYVPVTGQKPPPNITGHNPGGTNYPGGSTYPGGPNNPGNTGGPGNPGTPIDPNNGIVSSVNPLSPSVVGDERPAEFTTEFDIVDPGDVASAGKLDKQAHRKIKFVKGRHMPQQVMIAMDISGHMKKVDGALGKKGYKLRSSNKFSALDLALNVYTIPKKLSVKRAVTSLRKAYPTFIVDANHMYDLHAGASSKQKSILQWGAVPKSCGKGLKIGLLDTGLESGHSALKGRYIKSKNFLPKNEKPAPKSHATAITSIWLGKKTGLAPSAQVYVASVFRREKQKKQNKTLVNTNTLWLLSGLDWLVRQNVDVINLSFGGPINKVFEKAIVNVQRKGMVFVASAGNNGPDAPAVFPAAHGDVIAVTAIDSKLKIYSQANAGQYIDFAAPGVNILVAKPGNGKKIVSGTSYAAPFVAAAVAMLNQNQQKGLQSKMRYLKTTSKDLGIKGKDPAFGWGLIQMTNACVAFSNSKKSKIKTASILKTNSLKRKKHGKMTISKKNKSKKPKKAKVSKK